MLHKSSRWESRLLLNPDHPRVRQDITDVVSLQQTVMLGYPDDMGETARADARLLWRLHEVVTDADRYLTIITRSQVKPDWSRLPRGYLLQRPTMATINDMYHALLPGMNAAFSILANPSKRIRNPNDPLSGKRVEIREDTERVAWLRRQGMRNGFEVEDAAVVSDRRLTGTRGQKTITVVATELHGTLRVTDRAALLDAFVSGIGPAKAFGCGLLFVQRGDPE